MPEQQVRREEAAPASAPVIKTERQRALTKTSRIIWLLTGILEALIGIRVILKLIAANPDAGFARFIYGMTEVFLVPFQGLTPTPAAGASVLEIPSLIAMAVYALISWIIVRGMWIILDDSE
jgi:hypothetical protein